MAHLTVTLSEPMAAKLGALPPAEQRKIAEEIRELAEEAIKMREFPDIYFMDGATGRRAVVSDGIDVWEIIEPYYVHGKSWDVLRESYPDLPESVLRAAIRYYEAYPEEIEERIRRNQDVES